MSWADLVLSALAVPILLPALYLAGLAILARRKAPPPPRSDVRFDVVIPAHDEETTVAETVRSVLDLEYPRNAFRVVVVADNCSDRTRERAEAGGARVLVRDDDARRGKGYALAFAFERLLAEPFADAVVVVDADTLVSANLLGAFASRFRQGAGVVQARYCVRNPAASWRTRLLHLAFTLFHVVRSRGRERLSLSCGLRGNGMGFSRQALGEVPYDAFSLVEDVEYGISLGRAGYRVQYVDEAFVLGEMPASEAEARSQRRRWEGGRARLARQQSPRLLREAFARRSAVLLDLGIDLAVPPLSSLVLAALLGLSAALLGQAFHLETSLAIALWSVAAISLATYVAHGLWLSELGWQGVRDLAHVPGYLAWKLLLRWQPERRHAEGWVRTTREKRTP